MNEDTLEFTIVTTPLDETTFREEYRGWKIWERHPHSVGGWMLYSYVARRASDSSETPEFALGHGDSPVEALASLKSHIDERIDG